MDIVTRLFTLMNGRQVGVDATGNRYFTEKRERAEGRTKRWVVYNGEADASAVPPEWHAWLHYTVDAPLSEAGRKPWQKPHQRNLTGTSQRYRPTPISQKAAASADYEAWTPGQ